MNLIYSYVKVRAGSGHRWDISAGIHTWPYYPIHTVLVERMCIVYDRYDSNDNASAVLVKAPSFAEPNSNPFPCGEKGVEKKLLPCPAGMH